MELLEANRKIASVFMMCRRQYITAEEGRIVGLSIPAVKIAMDLYGVMNQKECLERVTQAFFHFESKRQR